MSFEHIIYEKERQVARITLNRPAVLNALQPLTCAELAAAVRDYLADDTLRVAILTGAGEKAFCTGADLKYRVAAGEQPATGRASDELDALLAQCNKPLVAAVNGYAVAGGLEMALRCDLILAASHARFGLPEVKRGLVADGGGIYHLSQRIPYHQAMGLALTGALITADEAFRLGLVNAVVPASELAAATRQWADQIVVSSPLAVQAAKEMLRAFRLHPHEPGLAAIDRLPAVQRLRESEDYVEGPRAFAEKRAPIWTGRPRNNDRAAPGAPSSSRSFSPPSQS